MAKFSSQDDALYMKALKLYNYHLQRHPLLTKCCTSAVTSSLGNYIAQTLGGQSDLKYRNIVAFAIFGFFGTGPATHYFYRYLAAAVKPTDKNSNVIKLTIERLFFAPSFLLLFFYSIPLLEGKGLTAAHDNFKVGYLPSLKANWKFWSFLQYINLKYVPQQYQTLFTNVIALLWNIYLSTKQS
ncbi:PXMP2 [Bugula neritina]|uniref:PXMP2 n=1 Tax=Bugula neritina TaxID=10212 RepID=A0A7J7JHG8_BUGNE|nr:PXMP2 [Bugula neritina]